MEWDRGADKGEAAAQHGDARTRSASSRQRARQTATRRARGREEPRRRRGRRGEIDETMTREQKTQGRGETDDDEPRKESSGREAGGRGASDREQREERCTREPFSRRSVVVCGRFVVRRRATLLGLLPGRVSGVDGWRGEQEGDVRASEPVVPRHWREAAKTAMRSRMIGLFAPLLMVLCLALI